MLPRDGPMEPPRRIPWQPEPERGLQRRRWRLPSPRELVAAVSVLLVVGNALVDRGSLFPARTSPTTTEPPLRADTLASTTAAATAASQLWELAASRVRDPRGVVLPLFDGIAALGVSLLLELRALQVELPVEIPHCGDLDERSLVAALTRHNLTHHVTVVDVCEAAAALGPLVCESLADCHARFRSFDLKILALLFSRFDESLLVDADVLFFQSPASLWTLDAYVATGTLFFPDRISGAGKYLSRPSTAGEPSHSRLHEFIETFDRTPFRHLETVTPREGPQRGNAPSDYLRTSHAWNLRAGHQADSSVLLWNKHKLPRATAVLGSFVARQPHRPPSYGDKELYFLACEVADARYAFSHFGAGAVGWDVDHDRAVLCGDVLHFVPVNDPDAERTSALYINSDHITRWKAEEKLLYRSNARPANHYPGSFGAKNLSQECPFDIQPVELTTSELAAFRRRQQWYERVIASWPVKAEAFEEDKEEDDDHGGLIPS